MFVVGPDIAACKAFYDDDHNVFRSARCEVRGARIVYGVEDGLQLILITIVCHDLKVVFPEGSDERERSIQDNAGLHRTVTVVVRVRDGDGTDIARPATTHTGNTKRDKGQQSNQHHWCVYFPW